LSIARQTISKKSARGGSNFSDAERKLLDDVIDKVDCIGLGVFVVDLERANARRIIDGGVLEPAHGLTIFTLECQELDIHLDVVPRPLFLVPLGVHFAHPRASGEPVEAIALQNAIDPGIRDFHVMVARQIPDNPDWSEVVFSAKIKDLLDDLRRCLICRVLRDRLGIGEPCFAVFSISFAPAIETGLADPEISARLAGVANLLRVLKHSQFALNLALFVRH